MMVCVRLYPRLIEFSFLHRCNVLWCVGWLVDSRFFCFVIVLITYCIIFPSLQSVLWYCVCGVCLCVCVGCAFSNVMRLMIALFDVSSWELRFIWGMFMVFLFFCVLNLCFYEHINDIHIYNNIYAHIEVEVMFIDCMMRCCMEIVYVCLCECRSFERQQGSNKC